MDRFGADHHHSAVKRYQRPFASSECQRNHEWVGRAFGGWGGGASSCLLVSFSAGCISHRVKLMVSSDMAVNEEHKLIERVNLVTSLMRQGGQKCFNHATNLLTTSRSVLRTSFVSVGC